MKKAESDHSEVSNVVSLESEREKRTPTVDPLDYPIEGNLSLTERMLNATKPNEADDDKQAV